MKRYVSDEIIKCLQENNLLNDEIKELLVVNEDNEESVYSLNEVHNIDELEILKDYNIVSVYESEHEVTVTVKETNIVLSRKTDNGRNKYRELVISDNGDRYLSEEFD